MSRVIERPNPSAASELLQHAIRRWEAELEFARRAEDRLSRILTLVTAILGLGILNVGALGHVAFTPPGVILRWYLAARLVWLFGVVLMAARRPPSASGVEPATHLLRLSPGRLPVEDMNAEEVRRVAWGAIDAAATRLQVQNTWLVLQVDLVQRRLLWAGIYALTGIIWYLLTPVPLE